MANHKLVIVESPAKGKTIEKFLGKGYKVIASQGHIRDLPKSQLGIDTVQNFDMHYITIRGRGDILASIRKEAKNASAIFLATDPDREGEAISWHLAQALGLDPEKCNRVEFHEITKNAVKEAITKPRSIDMSRVDAQQARRALDRLVGYQISPLLWAKVKKGLSAGRVQSVATRMIVEREDEINAFIPEEYWLLSADFSAQSAKGKKSTFSANFSRMNGEKATLHSEEETSAISKKILSGKFTVQSSKLSPKYKKAQPPFTTSSLQQEASKKLNFSTAKTMQVVQQLYEGIELGRAGFSGLVTYIRTDSVRVSKEAVEDARSHILTQYGDAFLPSVPNEYKGRKDAQDAHEAIRPTGMARTPESVREFLTNDQFKLYRLIYTRFLASQMAPAAFDTCSADLVCDSITMRYYGEHMSFEGYRKVYEESADGEEEEKDSQLPVLADGQQITFTQVHPKQCFTQAPPRYTEASLVKTMEENGIGRPSTYAPTITTIITRGYVAKENKQLYPTELGCMINALMVEYFGKIIGINFTASLEDRLDQVEEGKEDWHSVLKDFYPPFKSMLENAEGKIEKVEIADEVSDVPCDKCGAMMVYKMSRYGRFLACPNFPECRNTKNILVYIDAPCPKCGGRLLEKTSRKNRKFFGCEHYPECDFVSWDKPVSERCPKCGSYMVLKYGKQHEEIHLCSNQTCLNKVVVEPAEEKE